MQHGPQSAVASCPEEYGASSRPEVLLGEACSNSDLSFPIEALDGSSGAIAERPGLKGLWAYRLSIACSHGCHESNKGTADQLVDLVERIVASTELLVLVDGHRGCGNFVNGRLLARELRRSLALNTNSAESARVNSSRNRQLFPKSARDRWTGRSRSSRSLGACGGGTLSCGVNERSHQLNLRG